MGGGGYLYSFHRTELGRHNRLEERKSQVSSKKGVTVPNLYNHYQPYHKTHFQTRVPTNAESGSELTPHKTHTSF